MSLDSIEDVDRIGVICGGETGRGIATVPALAGYECVVPDVDEDQLQDELDHAVWSFRKQVQRGNVTQEEADAALERLSGTQSPEEAVARPTWSRRPPSSNKPSMRGSSGTSTISRPTTPCSRPRPRGSTFRNSRMPPTGTSASSGPLVQSAVAHGPR
jgi:hypothetical protein